MHAKTVEKYFLRSLPAIQSAGMMLFDPEWARRTHSTYGGCELIHVIHGSMELFLANKSYSAERGDTLLIPKGIMHRDAFDVIHPPEVFFCQFQWAQAKPYFRHVSNRHLLALSNRAKTEIRLIIDQIRSDLSRNSAADRLVNSSRILSLLMLILREALHGASTDDISREDQQRQARAALLMRRAKHYVERHFQEPITLDRIAAALQVSPYYLSHIFSRESEFTLFSYLTALRMEKAKILLLDNRHNVSEAAYAAGYQSANYFSKVFKHHCGCAPRNYALAINTRRGKVPAEPATASGSAHNTARPMVD